MEFDNNIDPDKQEIIDAVRLIKIGESSQSQDDQTLDIGRLRLKKVVIDVLDCADSKAKPAFLHAIDWLSYLRLALPKDEDINRVYQSYKQDPKTDWLVN